MVGCIRNQLGDPERERCYMTEVLRVKDVSRVLQVSLGQARELICSGRIPKIAGLNSRTIRVSSEALDAFIKTGVER